MYRKASKGINETFFRLRLIVLIALTTGMRIAEIFGLKWPDVMYKEELIAVRAKLKGGKMRYVPMPPELAAEFRRYPAILGEEQDFPPEPGAKRERQRVDKSFETILQLAGIEDFRFHDLRHTLASWYMMNGGDLYELAKILGSLKHQDDRALREASKDPHRKDRKHGPGDVEADGRKFGEQVRNGVVNVPVLFPRLKPLCFWRSLSALECGGQGRNRTADASLFRAALYQLSYLAVT